jgi:hypothetical protein
MEKSLFSKGYTTFLSKCERGERRIDVIELRAFCKAMKISFVDFIRGLDAELN